MGLRGLGVRAVEALPKAPSSSATKAGGAAKSAAVGEVGEALPAEPPVCAGDGSVSLTSMIWVNGQRRFGGRPAARSSAAP